MRSDEIKTGTEKAPHRALLKSLGLQDDDMHKPFIGIANSYTNIVPGHIHLRTIGEAVKEGILVRRRHTIRIQHHCSLRRQSPWDTKACATACPAEKSLLTQSKLCFKPTASTDSS